MSRIYLIGNLDRLFWLIELFSSRSMANKSMIQLFLWEEWGKAKTRMAHLMPSYRHV